MVRIEFYGVPRLRAGTGPVELENVVVLGEALAALAQRFPKLREDCLQPASSGGWELSKHCVANLGGQRFVRDPRAALQPGDVLLIFSADAGG